MSTQTAPAPAESAAPPVARKPAGAARPARAPRQWTSKAVVNGLLVVFAAYTLMPLTWLVIASTKNHRDLFRTNPFELGDFNLFSNLQQLFTHDDGIYTRWLANSVLYSVIGSLLCTLISVACGYALDKYRFPGKEKLFGFVLVGVLVPSTVTAMPLYLLASKVGVVNTYWAVLIPSLASPFGVYLARVFSEGYVPNEVLEAARMDGAGELKIFTKVALPMLAPGFMTIFLFTFTSSWNNFYSALMMLNDEELYPVNLGIFAWQTSVMQQPELYQLMIVGSLVAVIPLILAFLGLQRFWRSGLTAGAVK